MDIRAIAMDLDRTTLNRAGRLSPGNRAALDYAISRGVQVIPASGRAFTTLPQDILDIPGISYCVTSNGAAVCSVPGGEVLMRRCLPPHLAARILDLSDEQGVTYEAFVNGVAYADTLYMADPLGMGASPDSVEYLFTTRRPAENIRLFIEAHAHELDSIDVICWDEAKMDRLRRRFESRGLDEEAYITSSSHQRLEFSHLNTGKHVGVAWVLEQLGIAPAQLAAFGDGDNDAHLLEMAGIGIAVANATPMCRRAADMMTLAYDEDGLAYAIREILGI